MHCAYTFHICNCFEVTKRKRMCIAKEEKKLQYYKLLNHSKNKKHKGSLYKGAKQTIICLILYPASYR